MSFRTTALGNLSLMALMAWAVSPTERVVWVSTATSSSESQSVNSASAVSSIRVISTCPIVPRTSWWPLCPTNKTFLPSRWYFLASLCTLVTKGQTASMTVRFNALALMKSSGGEPWAENITREPSGTSSMSSTVIAPRRSRSLTTYGLWTI